MGWNHRKWAIFLTLSTKSLNAMTAITSTVIERKFKSQLFCRLPAGKSLFYYKPTKTKCNIRTPRHCICKSPDDIDKDLVINCNSNAALDKDVNEEGCSRYSEYKFSDTHRCNHTQRKSSCKTIDMPDDDETTFLIYDPKPRNITVPTWPTGSGKTLAAVTAHCNNAIRNSQAGKVCRMIASFDFQMYIDQCVEDTKVKNIGRFSYINISTYFLLNLL